MALEVTRILFQISFLLCFTQNLCNAEPLLQVIDSVNAGGDEHIDLNGILYKPDPLRGKIGTESDYGKSLVMIGRVPPADEILYQTERYSTETFGYDLKVSGDGDYALVLKFCEVYFNAPNMKVFDVILNDEHKVIRNLDIFKEVGKGVAHDEYIFFAISRGRLQYKNEESEIRGGKMTVSFVKTNKDNPKINAIALLKGDVRQVPKLPPLDDKNSKQNNADDIHEHSAEDGAEELSAETVEEIQTEKSTTKNRKTSGPKQPNPYTVDDTSVMLPVFMAIGAFIPLLFCLCKL